MKPADASMPSDTEVLVKRSFAAPVTLVWRAYAEPDLVRRWMLGPPGWSMPVCEMDFRVGGKYRWCWRNDVDGKEFGFSGEFQIVTPHCKLVHTQFYDPGDLGGSMGQEGAVVTVTFKEADGVTSVATSIKFASKADRDAAFSTGMTDGMEMSYKLLDGVLAVAVPAYFVATVEIHDPAGFQPYHEQFQATLAPFGGRLVSFGAPIVPLEGMDGSTARAAIVVFPSLQAARDWFESPAYRKIAPLRQRSARTRGFFVEGLPVRKE